MTTLEIKDLHVSVETPSRDGEPRSPSSTASI